MNTKEQEVIALLITVAQSALGLVCAMDDRDRAAIDGQREELSEALEALRRNLPGNELLTAPDKAETFFRTTTSRPEDAIPHAVCHVYDGKVFGVYPTLWAARAANPDPSSYCEEPVSVEGPPGPAPSGTVFVLLGNYVPSAAVKGVYNSAEVAADAIPAGQWAAHTIVPAKVK